MTQQEQHEFRESLAEALSWMQAVQERLKQNDNTQGPRSALEVRLRETEKIHSSEPEGHVKMDRVLVASEALLRNGDEEMKNQTLSKLKDIKALWEETSTYIIHCHSRIEWVWLHWSEYLKAYEEFGMWLEKMHRSLEPLLEMQLGLQEKLWQVDHLRVLHSDIQAQAQFLERLLDEAAALFNRTEDPSVDEKAQLGLQDAYDHIRDRAQERLTLAQKIAEEHQQYQSCVDKFQTWLMSKTEEVSRFSDMEDTTQNRLKALQELNASIAKEELTLQHIENLSKAVKANTSPAGAEKITKEMEELRQAWQRLRQALLENQEELQSSLDSESEYSNRCKELWTDLEQLRTLVQILSSDLESRDGERTEENMVAQWKTHTGVRNKLIAEEPRVEQLKSRLKELFRFPQDSKSLSDEMLAVVKEYQSVKGRSFRLSSESEMALRQILQDPLYGFSQWSQVVSQVLEASAEVTDFSQIALLVQHIEKLLKNSVQLQERLSLLQVKSDLLISVFGQEKADDLLKELSGDMRKRELLHSQLLKRKNRLQGLISKTKDFSDAYDSIHKKLSSIKEQFITMDGLQPDILAKKTQADQLRVIRKDLEDCEAQIIALETLVSSNPANRTKFERLYADWKLLYKAVRIKVNESEENIAEHESFHDNILNMEKWLMIMRQKLESFRGSDGEWSIDNRQHEAERALGEFPEKELQLHQTEAQGQTVLVRTSDEGKVHIQQDLKRLRETWMSLHTLSLNLYRLLNEHAATGDQDSLLQRTEFLDRWAEGHHQGTASNFEVGLAKGDEGTDQHQRSYHGSESTGHPEPERNMEANPDRIRIVLPEGISRPGGSEVWRREWTYQDQSMDDEVDAVISGSDRKVNRKRTGMDEGDMISSGGWTGEWVEQYKAGSGIEDLDIKGRHSFLSGIDSDAQKRMRPSQIPPDDIEMGSRGPQHHADMEAQRREFEAWLHEENGKLTGILNNQRSLSAKELRIRQNTLKGLRANVAWGQSQFQKLMVGRQSKSAEEDMELEELRYCWMLYKSKLKEAGDLRGLLKNKGVSGQGQEHVRSGKGNSGLSFLYRVCRVALPLQLLLLALLLLAFLLPMMDEGTSCSLSNNFARSFNIMLRYDGPPPT
ncbi:nesprin-3 isoform X1 [Sinocyclocheilus rhinocerous]|uniref:nesprin-3 isoform X1 n=1 Tax=Sinocyclocheilus rhinocerous TaxID=307959 RepID=UPI0007BA9196|nr:PREDICTED: nesprin-3-like isoform X1 [Sinocyclocheilus rhinocerous]XP_016428184.1 PREDICTED: nesprin-3-like isoform X1 [Sinocyclocheilus rhinocerous]